MKLSIENVGKCYRGRVWALRQFSLDLKPGVLGLLGPNGAGKTTLMSVLATITRATEGRVLWNGVDLASEPNALRRVLGYLPQDFGVYPNLNAQEFLEYLAAVKGLDATVRAAAHRSAAGPGESAGCAEASAGGIFGRDEAAGGDCAGAAERS